MTERRHRRLRARLALLICGVTAASLGAAGPAAAATHNPIVGDGSSWAANAANQWVADTQPSGLKVVFTSTGSAQGRKDFAGGGVDFALSDIPYGADPSDQSDTPNGRGFAYVPIVAGGTAFPYNLKVAGQQVRNLRLSGETIAKIFTNAITNWNDPQITKDNNGHSLPAIPIIPVVRSDGSGATAQFTRYLDKAYPSIWQPFQGSAGLTEYFPRKDPQVAQNGSDGVMNFVTSDAGAGAIGFDEYSYALQKNFPVVKLKNAAGFYTLPTQYNDAVALTQAKINTTDVNDPSKYLTQNLDDVYTYNDPRTYPLSSYSYMIIPTGAKDPSLDTGKRQTLTDYMNYSLCLGQSDAGKLGYSPLPLNLVQAAFEQINKLGAADPGVDVSNVNPANCNNPTFDGSNPNNNVLAKIAPQPPACDQDGQGPCGTVDQVAANNNPAAQAAAAAITKGKTGTTGTTATTGKPGTKVPLRTTGAPGAAGKSSAAAGVPIVGPPGTMQAAAGTVPAAAGGATTAGTAPVSDAAVTGGGPAADPVTGAPVAGAADGSAGGAGGVSPSGSIDGSAGAKAAFPNATVLAASPSAAPTRVLAPLAVLLLVGILLVPAVLSRRLAAGRHGRRTTE